MELGEKKEYLRESWRLRKRVSWNGHLSLVHFIVGVGSPTELHGNRTSFIQGVVTVPPNDKILAGAGGRRPACKQHGIQVRETNRAN